MRTFAQPALRSMALLMAACTAAMGSGDVVAFAAAQVAQTAGVPTVPPAAEGARIPSDQLDSLVAPIALYPDPLLAQTLAASTYPLELLQLHQWLAKNPGLKDQALADAVAKQPWDPSVQAMAALPDVVKWLVDDIQWTTDLGNAFLAQQGDVMDAVQRMRRKAEDTGNLKSTPQQTVQTQTIESREVIVIEQADPQVVYVPSYNPVTVYGPPVYPYPPIYYPPVGYYAAGAAISFGVGVAMGAAWGGGWGWGAGWGHNDITINNNNNFNRNANLNGNRGNVGNGNRWQHQPQHRGGAPYSDRATADRFGGTTRGDSLANRQAGARQQVGRQGGNARSNAGSVGTSGLGGDRGGAAGGRGGVGAGDRGGFGGGGSRGNLGGGAGGVNRPGAGGPSATPRDLSRNGGGANRSAFGGGGFSGGDARANSQRGSSSMRPSGGANRGGGFSGGSRSGGFGGGSRGGGSRGAGSRGGGGRRR